MKLELLDSLSLPGNPDKPNEDAFAHAPHMAAVFDGVTAISETLMPGPSDPAWLAQFSARRLAAHSEDGGDPRSWIEHAARDAQKSFNALSRRKPKERYELPYASLMLAAAEGDALSALWFGDCALVVRAPGAEVTVLGDTLESRARERDRVTDMARAQNLNPAAKVARQEFLPELRARRNRFNTGEGTWLFAPDPRCAKHARAARTPAPPGTVAMLATDGFLALVTDYAGYTVAALLAAAETKGLASLGEELRTIETGDPEGVRYPRLKESDDATAVLLRVVDRASAGIPPRNGATRPIDGRRGTPRRRRR